MSKDSVMGKEGRPGKGLQKYPIVLCDETFADFLTRIGMSEEEYIVTVQGTTSLSPDPDENRVRVLSQYTTAADRFPRCDPVGDGLTHRSLVR